MTEVRSVSKRGSLQDKLQDLLNSVSMKMKMERVVLDETSKDRCAYES
jgi:hypothetical protein